MHSSSSTKMQVHPLVVAYLYCVWIKSVISRFPSKHTQQPLHLGAVTHTSSFHFCLLSSEKQIQADIFISKSPPCCSVKGDSFKSKCKVQDFAFIDIQWMLKWRFAYDVDFFKAPSDGRESSSFWLTAFHTVWSLPLLQHRTHTHTKMAGCPERLLTSLLHCMILEMNS